MKFSVLFKLDVFDPTILIMKAVVFEKTSGSFNL